MFSSLWVILFYILVAKGISYFLLSSWAIFELQRSGELGGGHVQTQWRGRWLDVKLVSLCEQFLRYWQFWVFCSDRFEHYTWSKIKVLKTNKLTFLEIGYSLKNLAFIELKSSPQWMVLTVFNFMALLYSSVNLMY